MGKRIGILTSGGDCAGLNAAIRAVVYHAIGTYGYEVFGIHQATLGLLERPPKVKELTRTNIRGLLLTGGTILGTTNKGDPFAYPMPDGTLLDRSQEMIEGYHQLGLDALLVIGGDGSLAILRKLAQQGNMNIIGIPKTIDNDIGITERSIGFQTAVNIATEALDRLQFTAASHSRVLILEVMGRDAGHIAISAGIAGGADVILIPEIPYDIQKVCKHIVNRRELGKSYSLVIVSEAVKSVEGGSMTNVVGLGESRYGGIGQEIAKGITSEIGAETRVTVLGHTQRGGIPAPIDRLVASAFGVAAVDLVAQEMYDHVVTWQHRQVVSVPIEKAIEHYQTVNPEGTLVKTARGLGICLGD
ncbi:ATP-dependent 6-phosphofructokinase [Roseofilum reptotaenium CS-1145]|uniref:ATP-dependent 6-phosphofructokinase n=1 Tax=Roseofilum reptotaenium AO1-A TaxID=1925591 RepID=A0A1L9QR31_9CYAN|nr:ATP-dependent 6-phosphofructokinase [Roseofilum reptotaenium]MDB9516878.1 ATP-dependent 6-phosphofructokinase [Roseofilum reptotaenium CS-1145]OJJ25086.1 6-phosphofructokinase [Roseofilum reptotaenium AO1-A]